MSDSWILRVQKIDFESISYYFTKMEYLREFTKNKGTGIS